MVKGTDLTIKKVKCHFRDIIEEIVVASSPRLLRYNQTMAKISVKKMHVIYFSLLNSTIKDLYILLGLDLIFKIKGL